jgi:hypothetical protein
LEAPISQEIQVDHLKTPLKRSIKQLLSNPVSTQVYPTIYRKQVKQKNLTEVMGAHMISGKKSLLAVVAILGFTIGAPAIANSEKNCREQAIEASKHLSPHLVLSFEGLFIPAKGILYRSLITPLSKQKPKNLFYQQFRYSQAERATTCVLAWEKILGKDGFTISVLGHSFGGGIGAPRLVKNLDRYGLKVKNLITMDPRDNSSKIFRCPSAEVGREKYAKLNNVESQISFFQCGRGLPGEHFSGVRNIEIKGHSHGNLPSSSLIYSITSQMIQ